MGRNADREVYLYIGSELKSQLEDTLEGAKKLDPFSPESMSSICRRALAAGLPFVREHFGLPPLPAANDDGQTTALNDSEDD